MGLNQDLLLSMLTPQTGRDAAASAVARYRYRRSISRCPYPPNFCSCLGPQDRGVWIAGPQSPRRRRRWRRRQKKRVQTRPGLLRTTRGSAELSFSAPGSEVSQLICLTQLALVCNLVLDKSVGGQLAFPALMSVHQLLSASLTLWNSATELSGSLSSVDHLSAPNILNLEMKRRPADVAFHTKAS